MQVSWIPGTGGTEVLFISPTYTGSQPDLLGKIPVLYPTTIAPEQDGETVLGSYLTVRDTIILTYLINAGTASDLAIAIRAVSRAFSPKSGAGTLKVITDDTQTFYLDCRIKPGYPIFPIGTKDRSSTGSGLSNYFQRFTVVLVAHSPFWYTASQSQEYAAWTGWTFPIEYPFEYGSYSQTLPIVTAGDLDTPLRCQIDGPMVNPKLTNKTTGEFISITKTLTAGQRLYIETTFGNITCEIRNATTNALIEDAFKYASVDTTWFWLISSDRAPALNAANYGTLNDISNRVRFESSDANDGSSMIMTWADRYSAV
jgi:hypothetical protein